MHGVAKDGDTLLSRLPSPKDWHITSQADFAKVFSTRQRSRSHYLHIYWRNDSLERPRLGLAIAMRLTKTAVQRNRLRRGLYEYFRQNLGKLPANDFVISLRRPCYDKACVSQVIAEFKSELNKLV